MSFFKVTSIVIGTTIALAVVGTVAWFSYVSAVFKETCLHGYRVAEGFHEKLMESDDYRLTDLGNRIMWITALLDDALDTVCVDLDDEKTLMVKQYVYNSLETICAI